MKIVHIKFAFSKEVQAFFWDSLFQFILHKCLKYVSLIKTSFASRIFKLQNFTPPSWDLAVWSVKSREDSCLSHTLFLCSAHASIRSERTKTMWVLCFRSYYKCCDNWRFCINLLSYKIKKKKTNFFCLVIWCRWLREEGLVGAVPLSCCSTFLLCRILSLGKADRVQKYFLLCIFHQSNVNIA